MDKSRMKMEEENRKLVEAHKCKEMEKKRQQLLKKIERHSFLNTDAGNKLRSESAGMNGKDLDDKMKMIRQKQQEMYSRTNAQKD